MVFALVLTAAAPLLVHLLPQVAARIQRIAMACSVAAFLCSARKLIQSFIVSWAGADSATTARRASNPPMIPSADASTVL